MLKGGGGGGTTSFEVVITKFFLVLIQKLEVLAILMGGGGVAKSFHPLKGGTRTVFPCLEREGGTKSFRPGIFLFFSPPPFCN